jgi:hypothetical protein
MLSAEQQEAAQLVIPSLDTAMQYVWQRLGALHPLEAGLLLLPVGLVFLLYGFKLYKWLVSVVYAGIGASAGAAVALWLGWDVILGTIAGALLLGLLAWPLHRVGWGLLGGALFGGAAVILMRAQTPNVTYIAAVAGVAFIGGFVLTLILMRPLIILVTSVIGAAVVVQGALRLSLIQPAFGDPVLATLEAKPYLLAILVAIPALLGFILQWRNTAGKGKAAAKRKKAEEAEE